MKVSAFYGFPAKSKKIILKNKVVFFSEFFIEIFCLFFIWCNFYSKIIVLSSFTDFQCGKVF